MTDLADALSVLERLAPEVPPEAVPGTVTRLAAVLALLGARMVAPATNGDEDAPGDRLLTAREVSARTTLSVAYVYRHADALPFFSKRVGRKVLFSEVRLARWLARRGS